MNKKKILAFLTAVAMTLALSGCAPMQYRQAAKMMANSEWSDAREILASIEDYEDSAELLAECDYNIALADMESGDYRAAAGLLEALGEHKDSTELLSECKYNIALADMESGDYDAAAGLFEALGDYKDSADMAKECRYQNAVALYDAGSYEEALAIFSEFDDYKDEDRYCVLCMLLTDQAGFVDKFAEGMDYLFEVYDFPYQLEDCSSNGDERVFVLGGQGGSGNTFTAFSPMTEDLAGWQNGQINGITVSSDASSPAEIITAYPEFAYTSGIMLSVLCDDPDPSEEMLMINDLMLELPEKGTASEDSEDPIIKYRFEHNGYDCVLSCTDFGGGYTRFCLVATIPELMDANANK